MITLCQQMPMRRHRAHSLWASVLVSSLMHTGTDEQSSRLWFKVSSKLSWVRIVTLGEVTDTQTPTILLSVPCYAIAVGQIKNKRQWSNSLQMLRTARLWRQRTAVLQHVGYRSIRPSVDPPNVRRKRGRSAPEFWDVPPQELGRSAPTPHI